MILFILLPALFLQGCTQQEQPDEPPVESEAPVEAVETPPEVSPVVRPQNPGQFTLRYDPNSTLNPITALNRDNILIASLLYESLFVLDGSLEAHPVLCESWSTEDNTVFTFDILPDIAMSDGSTLTAEDVAYTLRQAMLRGRYVNRFGTVASVAATEDLTVTIELNTPNYRFICLLDVPIIKNGSIESRVPPGTGAYVLSDTDEIRLDRFIWHRNHSGLPLPVIHLLACADNDLTMLFDDGRLSLLWDDPSDAFDIRLNRLHEKRYYDTTVLQFIGFNGNHIALRDPDIRRAIGAAIDRQYIIDNIMTSPGSAIASPLAISPAFHLYDAEWENMVDLHPLEEMAVLLDRARLADFDEDSFLELGDGYGGYTKFTIDFIVNSENIHKVRAAHKITETLRQNGLDVTVRELTWDRFITALRLGDFDMYYGETQLGADFDLSPLLLPGGLNYGRVANTDYKPYIDDFLAAQADEDIQHAAYNLCYQIKIYAPISPILYKRYFIYTPIGAVSGASPGQSNVFRNFTDWTVNLYMLV